MVRPNSFLTQCLPKKEAAENDGFEGNPMDGVLGETLAAIGSHNNEDNTDNVWTEVTSRSHRTTSHISTKNCD